VKVLGITWHAVTLDAEAFAAQAKLLRETMGLEPGKEREGFALFPFPRGDMLELYAPDSVPPYGFNDGGVTIGFRVDDIEAASRELAAAGCELLGQITRMADGYAYRHFRAPDGRVYGLNESPADRV